MLFVAAGADRVTGHGLQLCDATRVGVAVGIVAIRTGELHAAAAEQEVASFSRIHTAAPGVEASLAAFPGVRVARKQHRVALGAAVRNRQRFGHLLAALGAHAQKLGTGGVARRDVARVFSMRACSTMTRLATDAD